MDDFRCSAASAADGEPLWGTAPTESAWLLLEYAGPWGRQAVAETRWPDAVRSALAELRGFRVQLIRRPVPSVDGLRVFAATASHEGFDVGTTTVAEAGDLPELARRLDPAIPGAGLPAHGEPLWLVCTNGRRDRCCAELGRPVAAALAAVRPEATWETTHLGGHRFAATMVCLPSGVTLGRVTADEAAEVCRAVERGDPPWARVRGRAGLSPVAQVAELHVRADQPGTAPARVHDRGHGRVEVSTERGGYLVTVAETPAPPRRQSCGDDRAKPTVNLAVESVRRLA